MAKKEKVVDLTPKPEKISEELLDKIKDLIKEINLMHHEIGVIESKKHSLIHNMALEQKKMFELQEELKEKYGTDNIDVNDGTINYPKENGEVNKKD